LSANVLNKTQQVELIKLVIQWIPLIIAGLIVVVIEWPENSETIRQWLRRDGRYNLIMLLLLSAIGLVATFWFQTLELIVNKLN
jgi:small-conductance mechanosensitive channel